MKKNILTFALAAFLAITATPSIAVDNYDRIPETGNTFSFSQDAGISPAPVIPIPWGDLEGLYGYIAPDDVDYLVFSMLPDDECTGFVAFTLWIVGVPDLDMEVFDLNGLYLDGSFGYDDEEFIFLSTEDYGPLPQTLVLKIYGFMGVAGSYSLRVRCAK